MALKKYDAEIIAYKGNFPYSSFNYKQQKIFLSIAIFYTISLK
jgi:hypothetical protein